MNLLVIGSLFLLFSSALCYSTCPSRFQCKCTEKVNYLEIECDSKSLTLGRVQNVLNAFNKSDTIELILIGIDLGSVPSNFFDGLNIRALHILNCDLISLSDAGKKPFMGLEDTLEELRIISSLSKNTDVDFNHLRSLEEVELSKNTINELGNDWFPDSVTSLTLTNNGIQKLGDRAFENLIKLESLHLKGNRLGSIRRSILPNPAENLRKLELENNSITSFPDDIFTNVPKLRIIILRNEGIRRLEKSVFSPIRGRQAFIDLRGNPLKCDSYIDWILYKRRHGDVLKGTCHSPLEKRYITLENLIKHPYPEITSYKNWEHRLDVTGALQTFYVGN